MPAKSQSQRRLIFSKRNQYKSKSKTPAKWKWVWDEELENKGKLPDKVHEEYRFTFTPEDVREMIDMEIQHTNQPLEVVIPWELYDENRDMFDENFGVEFSNGDRSGSNVKITDVERMKTTIPGIWNIPETVQNFVSEGSVGFEETKQGSIFLDTMYDYLMDEYNIDYREAEKLLDKYYELSYECFFDQQSAEECVDKIMELEKNVSESLKYARAKTINEWGDPTDYKDMIADDWNDMKERVLSALESGDDVVEIMGRPDKREEIYEVIEATEGEELEDIAKALMDNYYMVWHKRDKLRKSL